MNHRTFALRKPQLGWERLESRFVLDAQLVISELMASNANGLVDEDGEHVDWIELLNTGDSTASLDGWHLTDDPEELEKWTLPSRSLAPGETVIVFASGKDRADISSPLHTNFRLNAGGEYLALVGPVGDDVVFEIAPQYPVQRVDVSYGIGVDGEYRFFLSPTPNAVNGMPGYVGILDSVQVSKSRGFYEQPIDVNVSSNAAGATIVYTTDGSHPSLENGTTIPASDAENGPAVTLDVDETTVLRVAAMKDGFLSTAVDTYSYVFLSDVVMQSEEMTLAAGLPAAWGDVQADYGLDPDVIGPGDLFGGLYAEQFVDSLKAVPTLSVVLNQADMFGTNGLYTHPHASGVDWERPTSVELIYPDGRPGFQVDAGIRIQGGASRAHENTRKKSFRLVFRDAYGAGKLEFPFFGPDAHDRFDTITLRANYNDGWQHAAAGQQTQFIRDEWNRRTQLAMGQPSPHGTWVHLYLNGTYWGLYNPVERPDASFAAAYLGGEKDEWDVLNHSQVVDGTAEAWNRLNRLAADVDTTDTQQSNSAYQLLLGNSPDGTRNPELEVLLDVENMVDYLILNFYAGNVDWPRNNWYAARLRGSESTGFKFFAWDTEKSLGRQSPVAANVTIVSDGVAEVYGHLVANREFRRLFADRVQLHLSPGGALFIGLGAGDGESGTPGSHVPAERYDQLASQVELAVIAESARWGDQHRDVPFTQADWMKTREDILSSYFARRPDVVLGQLVKGGLFPQLSAPEFSQVSGTVPTGFELAASGPGTIFYTLDGSDPRIQDPTVDYSPLVPPDSRVFAHVPGDDSLQRDWTAVAFDSSNWASGTSGVGFERGHGYEELIGIDTGLPMFQTNASAYLRVPFVVDDPGEFGALELLMRYDDGFVAYLNGVEVARANAPELLAWNSQATTNHRDLAAAKFETFEVSDYVHLLQPGDNLLAIHGLNHGKDSEDFLITVQMNAGRLNNVPYSVAAIRYDAPIRVTDTAIVKARSLRGQEWSALSESRLTVAGPAVRIVEVMYHPGDPDSASSFEDDDFEFIEIMNASESETIDLEGMRLASGVRFTFPRVMLEPQQRAVVVRNLSAFQERYGHGIRVVGQYGGVENDSKLDNGGEILRLEDRSGKLIQELSYDDAWYPRTDGVGYSLTTVDPAGQWNQWDDAQRWRASYEAGGTPGRDDSVSQGDFDFDGDVDSADIDLMCAALVNSESRFDLIRDGRVDQHDLEYLIQDILESSVGDANLDRRFDSLDLELALLSGKYEDTVKGNSTWAEGDWDCDGDFDSDDVILALSTGRYQSV